MRQVAMKPMPFVIIDVRDKTHADFAPLPQDLGHVVHLPGLYYAVETYMQMHMQMQQLTNMLGTSRTQSKRFAITSHVVTVHP